MKYCFILILLLFKLSYCFGQKMKDQPTTYEDDLTFQWRKNTDTLTLLATSKSLAPIQIYFHLRKNNLEINSFLLNPKDSLALIKSKVYRSDSIFINKIRDSISISYFLGHKSLINPDLDYPYRLPFKKGKKYEVSQSFNGKVSHQSKRSKYAIDFQLDIGEPVYAARSGTVIKVIDWFTKHGGKDFRNAANKILILHSDGTLASYAHLDYKGSLVKEGDTVIKGQEIGVSGLTGYTRGPHLHFVVRKENDISIPVYFEGYMGKVLKQGKRYKVKP